MSFSGSLHTGIIMQSQHFPLNTRFKPSTSMMTWYRAGIALIIGLILLCSYVPAVLFGEMPAIFSVLILGSAAGIFLFLWIWVGMYYESMFYELRDDEINWKRGVWFRTTGIVPYNRITNLDVRQGPFMRMLKISNLAMQTAGYSGQAVPEIQIEAIEHAEELRELIRSLIRGCASHDDGTGSAKLSLSPTGKTTEQQILAEVQQIRSLLEQRR
jgi:membrane protein YdbS with pleckstrin-like domain